MFAGPTAGGLQAGPTAGAISTNPAAYIRFVIGSWKCVADREAMTSSWLKFRLVISSWVRIALKTKPVQWPDTDNDFG